ncbi:hypothetical protein SKAU_G00116730, partial [Synaphobranchus kaupii]
KSLYVQRLYEKLQESADEEVSLLKCIRLIEPRVDENVILKSLLNTPDGKDLTIFHFDVMSSVQKGLHEFLFRLLILRYLMDSEGRMWKCSGGQLYLIEILRSTQDLRRNIPRADAYAHFSFLDVFPTVICCPPKEVLGQEMMGRDGAMMEDPLMDDQEFRSEAYQRPYQYLTRFHKGENLDRFVYRGVEGTHMECLQILFIYCGVVDPSWAELRNFSWFLNVQLRDCETSIFCDVDFVGDTLQGFRNFVVDFMILMAKDFATPSLSISDQSPGRMQVDLSRVNEEDLAPFRIRKRWEAEPHPYIFFNGDHISMTFIGFHLRKNGQNGVDAIHPTSGAVIRRNIMTERLYEGLRLQRVPFNVDFDGLSRDEKIHQLCNVLGVRQPLDPDKTYELTTDNILKMLAIHMRFRCDIPVVVMGETGCGKTRLVRFLCQLRRAGAETQNMTLVKVHGGTTSEMIYSKVREAEAKAATNKQKHNLDSVLFFDEANTTEAVSSIKEVLCDWAVDGERLAVGTGLQIIAACNPYRKHSDEMIQRLESAGLGYRVRAEETEEKLGSIPLRQLVYRVQVLPPSMIPLVWDFGQLNDQTEKIYIQQIVQRVVQANSIDSKYSGMMANALSSSQRYMRSRKDECGFVSLRDVERCIQVFVWFQQNHTQLLSELSKYWQKLNQEKKKQMSLTVSSNEDERRDPVVWSLVMAIGVCYHACLENKEGYRKEICKSLPEGYTPQRMLREITLAQDLLLSGVPLGRTIARNTALKENVFMMVVCIELRIPLFLVGKPGSSKSLSKTLVADAMQGHAAHSELFRRLKQVHLVSFQCSPHSTPEGIINTFKQCTRFQEGKNLEEYVSVVVLDEIGLAEDSPKMPLKTLHPLLEEGCIDDEPLPHKKVGFIGISNWALDPAKMNRGVFVSRGDPDEKELIDSAKGICSSDRMVLEKVQDVFRPFAKAYLRTTEGKGFFGLRDYYSLIKMVFGFSKASKQRPSPEQIVEAVLRNFSGRDDVDVVSIFTNSMDMSPKLESTISTIELVRKNILAVGSDNECRYLLVLTKNYAALQILQQMFFSDQHQPEIIFGSSFPKDQEYTQICRNINRVKICMETGQTVILLNLQNLYESLYDALNQYYVCLGGQNYVDLGLGTHRVKCRVHPKFRLIVIEEKEVVYREFPVPLINRLEKHYLDINAVLSSDQKDTVKALEWWVEQFIAPNNQYSIGAQRQKYRPPDVFIGYHSDTCSSVVLQVTEKLKQEMETPDPWRRVLEEAKLILLNCATPDSVVRLQDTALPSMEADSLTQVYFQEQQHSSLAEFILSHTHMEGWRHSRITEVTTFSRLLTASDVVQLRDVVEIPSTELLSLQQFDTEQSFLKKIRNFLDSTPDIKMLIIQTDFDEGSQSACILASAKYSAINEINKAGETTGKVFVYFITKLPRMEGGTSYVGFHGGNWSSVHIDDLRRSKDIVSDIKALRSISISQLFQEEMDPAEVMEVDEAVPEQDEGLSEVLDTTALVRSCVQSAVSMLRDEEEGGARCTRRVEILLTLLAENEEMSAVFLKTVKRRLHSLLVAQDNHALLSKNWVLKEASNVNALQEGGTFKHTLWKRVQVAVTPLLARLVSVLDRDHNLDLLLDCNSGEWVKKLWLDMFGDESLLDIPYTRPNHSTDSENVLVQSHIRAGQGTGCAMPFSWRIREHLEEVWTQVQQRDDHTQQKFEVIFGKTPLGQLIAHTDRETQKELFQRYLQDFVSMTIKWTSEDELQLLSRALACGINELSAHRPVTEPPSLPWVHIAYQRFRTRLHNLDRMLTLLPHLAPPLLRTTPTGEKGEMVLDVFAALACVEHLEPQMLQSDDQRLAWLRQVKSLQVPLQLVCALEIPEHWGQRSRAVIGRARNGWNRIFVLSLFVEHLLLGVESVEEKLKALMLGHTLKLGNVLEKSSDLQLEASFLAVIEVLKSCKDAASGCIFEYGLGPCLVCLVDPQEPLVLPCGHVFCLGCGRHRLVPGQMYCPKCVCPVPDDFPLNVSEDVSGLVKFRKRCHSFFIELVSSACFRGNRPPSKGVIHHLLSFLMVEAEPVPLIRDQRQILTKALTPFHESVDRNPVVRSVVLKLLLKYSFSEVREYLEQHLSSVVQSIIVDEGDKCNLYALYINCLEDSMFERLQRHTAAERRTFLQVERDFLRYFLSCDPKSVQTVTVELLQQVARVRLCLDTAAQLLTHSLLGTPAEAEADPGVQCFLDSVRNLCTHGRNDWYRVYLIRLLCSRQGVEFVQNLLKEGTLPWLFPQEILTQKNEDGGRMDQYLVCGEGYKAIREAVAKATAGFRTEGIATVGDTAGLQGSGGSPAERTLYLLLALFREVTTLYRAANPVLHPTRELCKALEVFMKNSRVLVSREIRTFAVALVRNKLGPLCVQADRTGVEHTLTELAVHLSAVLLCGNDGVLKPLRQLALSPSKMQKSFIPTMPEDIQYMAVKALGAVETQPLKWYICQNGHPCAIGECGRPLQKSRCLDCGAEIGGEQHAPVTGFTETQTQTWDRTKPGHILGDPSRRDNPEALDTRNVSPVPFAILRMLTHLAMLLGVSAEPQSLGGIIVPPVQDPGVFLMQHLQKDLEQLTQTLGLGVDDTVSTVHLLLRSLLEPHLPSPGHAPYDDLATKEARHGWETAVINDVITPQLKVRVRPPILLNTVCSLELEQRLKEVNVSIRLDSRVTSNPVMKVVFGDPSLFLNLAAQGQSGPTGGAVWSCRERVCLCPTWPTSLGRKVAKMPFPFSGRSCRRRQSYGCCTGGPGRKRIRGFLSVWNQLRLSLATNGEIKIPAEFCRRTWTSAVICSYLIALHNQLIYATDNHTGEETSYRVSVTDLTELHVIGYEPERDLIPLILSNCQYSLERGQETLSQYDLPKIQQLILSRILQGKPFIDLPGIPALFTRQDRDYERIFTEVKGKVGQEPLPALKAASLGGALQAYSDVCETLGVVEVALDFLAAAGGDAHMELVPYLEDVLRMEQVAPHILKALSRCRLKHCVALWQFLSSLKSESMLHLKRDPFMGIGDQYRRPLGEEVRRLLTGFCSRGSVEAFLQEMHQFLLLHLNTNRDPDLYLPDWGLKETLQSYMERKDLDLPSEVEEIFPEEIRLSQALAAWRFTVAFKQGRSLR